ncbi:MAG: hypothetical protein WC847_01460 [Candidatus Paceibacterota bacterium]
MENTKDLLKIKIEKAKALLSEDTLEAINAVDWKAVILGIRETKGYSFEQLGDLETETDLLLCGLVSPENYSKELEVRMHLPRTEVNELVKEMNTKVFTKIKENLIKILDRKKVITTAIPLEKVSTVSMPTKPISHDTEEEKKVNKQVLNNAGIEILHDLPAVPGAQLMQAGKLELKGGEMPPILAQKLTSSVQAPVVATDHSLNNLSKASEAIIPETPKAAPTSYPPKGDPYRLPPD